MMCCGVLWYDAVSCVVEWYGVVWYEIVCYGIILYPIVMSCNAMLFQLRYLFTTQDP